MRWLTAAIPSILGETIDFRRGASLLLVLMCAAGALQDSRAQEPQELLPRSETPLEWKPSNWSVSPTGKIVMVSARGAVMSARWDGSQYVVETLGQVKGSIGFISAAPDDQHLLVQTTSGICCYSLAPFEQKWSHYSGIKAALYSSDATQVHFLGGVFLCTLRMSDGQRTGQRKLPFLHSEQMAWGKQDQAMLFYGLDPGGSAAAGVYAYFFKSDKFTIYLSLASSGGYGKKRMSANARHMIGYHRDRKQYDVWDLQRKELTCRIEAQKSPSLFPAISNDGRFAVAENLVLEAGQAPTPLQWPRPILYELNGAEAKDLGPLFPPKTGISRWEFCDAERRIVAMKDSPPTLCSIELPP